MLKRMNFDYTIITILFAFGVISTMLIYSATSGTKYEGMHVDHLVTYAVFFVLMLVCSLFDYKGILYPFVYILYAVGIVLQVLVLFIGDEHLGARRWIDLGFVQFQPSELMKIFAALYAADYTVRKLPDMGSFRRGFMPMAGIVVLVGMLLLQEPDFGATVVICSIAFGILFLGGMNMRVFCLVIAVAVVGLSLLMWLSPYRRDRLLNFMDPWQDPFDKGYQLSHALIAFGRGGWSGVGLGGSVEKLFYLPEAHTDFLLAVIAEEIGFVGVFVIIMLFALLVQRAFAIGRAAINLERYFSGLVAMGIGLWLGVQSFINMGVNMGLLPTKGLTLPLMSFGGSAIVASCFALALLLKIDWENRQVMRGGRA